MTEAIALVIAVALALVLAMGVATAIAVAMPMALAMIVWNDDDRRHGERHGDAIARANVAASESGFSFNILRLLAAAAKEAHRPAVLCTRWAKKTIPLINCCNFVVIKFFPRNLLIEEISLHITSKF
jgi:hydrogenase/urease accessory protein HupE